MTYGVWQPNLMKNLKEFQWISQKWRTEKGCWSHPALIRIIYSRNSRTCKCAKTCWMWTWSIQAVVLNTPPLPAPVVFGRRKLKANVTWGRCWITAGVTGLVLQIVKIQRETYASVQRPLRVWLELPLINVLLGNDIGVPRFSQRDRTWRAGCTLSLQATNDIYHCQKRKEEEK